MRSGSAAVGEGFHHGTGPASSKNPPIGPSATGRLVLGCDALHVDDADQTLVVYSAAPGTPAAEALALLRVVGLQQWSPSR